MTGKKSISIKHFLRISLAVMLLFFVYYFSIIFSVHLHLFQGSI